MNKKIARKKRRKCKERMKNRYKTFHTNTNILETICLIVKRCEPASKNIYRKSNMNGCDKKNKLNDKISYDAQT